MTKSLRAMRRYGVKHLDFQDGSAYSETVEAPDGEWVRWADAEAELTSCARLAERRSDALVDERDALKAEVERLKAERTQDVSIRREQCEALADSERGMFAAIDRHQMAAAEVERLRAALCEIAAGEHVQTSAAVAREALEKK